MARFGFVQFAKRRQFSGNPWFPEGGKPWKGDSGMGYDKGQGLVEEAEVAAESPSTFFHGFGQRFISKAASSVECAELLSVFAQLGNSRLGVYSRAVCRATLPASPALWSPARAACCLCLSPKSVCAS